MTREENEDNVGRRSQLKNVKWVAHYLGTSRNTIHQWVSEGHIPYINLGVSGGRRIIRFDPAIIEAWLEERSYRPQAGTGNDKTGDGSTEKFEDD